jgi:hypothetical protein
MILSKNFFCNFAHLWEGRDLLCSNSAKCKVCSFTINAVVHLSAPLTWFVFPTLSCTLVRGGIFMTLGTTKDHKLRWAYTVAVYYVLKELWPLDWNILSSQFLLNNYGYFKETTCMFKDTCPQIFEDVALWLKIYFMQNTFDVFTTYNNSEILCNVRTKKYYNV